MIYALSVWTFYMGFAAAISIYRLWLKGTLNLMNKVAYAPLLIIFYAIDIAVNWSALLLLGIPPAGCLSMSERFQVYHTGLNLSGTPFFATKIQRDVGTFICEKLLNPIDPTGKHC